MRKMLIWAIISFPLFSNGQEKGIVFIRNLTYQEILQKARTENKFIFIDCYATWCGPCKWMDQNVYVNESLGKFINRRFISVRLQMDSTGHDDPKVKERYEMAREIDRRFRVRAYPTYLFLSPDGKAVHGRVGAVNTQTFWDAAKDALDPQHQLYTLWTCYQNGERSPDLMYNLAIQSEKGHVDSLVKQVASEYMHEYLEKLPSDLLWNKININFISKFWKDIHYGDVLFGRFMEDKPKIDSVMGKVGYSYRLICNLVYEQEVKPLVEFGIEDRSEPDWSLMDKRIRKKYGRSYVTKNVFDGRITYYWNKKDWKDYARYFLRQVMKAKINKWPIGYMTSLTLNNDAFEIFKYSVEKKELRLALKWIDKAISMLPRPTGNELDTKANLLYKLGCWKEALVLEETVSSA